MTNLYFSQISQEYRQDKNLLETAAKAFAKEMSNRIVPVDRIEDFDNRLLRGIHAINLRFRKCNPLHFYKWRDSVCEERNLHRWSVDGVFMITLLPVNETPLPTV